MIQFRIPFVIYLMGRFLMIISNLVSRLLMIDLIMNILPVRLLSQRLNLSLRMRLKKRRFSRCLVLGYEVFMRNERKNTKITRKLNSNNPGEVNSVMIPFARDPGNEPPLPLRPLVRRVRLSSLEP